MMIDAFMGSYRFLSNFEPCQIIYDGAMYPSVEHAYQAAKTHDPLSRMTIRTASTAGKAKRLGNVVVLRPDWEEVKLDIMESFVRDKFSQEPFKQMLLDTNDQELVEGNWWHDTYWGVCNGEGENHLGRILMRIRAELA